MPAKAFLRSTPKVPLQAAESWPMWSYAWGLTLENWHTAAQSILSRIVFCLFRIVLGTARPALQISTPFRGMRRQPHIASRHVAASWFFCHTIIVNPFKYVFDAISSMFGLLKLELAPRHSFAPVPWCDAKVPWCLEVCCVGALSHPQAPQNVLAQSQGEPPPVRVLFPWHVARRSSRP